VAHSGVKRTGTLKRREITYGDVLYWDEMCEDGAYGGVQSLYLNDGERGDSPIYSSNTGNIDSTVCYCTYTVYAEFSLCNLNCCKLYDEAKIPMLKDTESTDYPH
jgi:hypothetical protein